MSKVINIYFYIVFLFLIGCGGSGNNDNTIGSFGGRLEGWQKELLGQEGHGGDAVVCFNIPIGDAVIKVEEEVRSCEDGTPCSDVIDEGFNSGGGSNIGPYWRMTLKGRKAISSSKPLEQYLAEQTQIGREAVELLNQNTVKKSYSIITEPLKHFYGAYEKLEKSHKTLGWLDESGITAKYGVLSVNDSGFATGIDYSRCRELQAVVRRDNQLWYDPDIVGKFDNAGKVIIQLHEEIYQWAKQQDALNNDGSFDYPPVHETSTNTRRFILKILNLNISSSDLNQKLKDYGFSFLHWLNEYSSPVEVGYYMDRKTCVDEWSILSNKVNVSTPFDLQNFVYDRYLKFERYRQSESLAQNYPKVIRDVILFMVREANNGGDLYIERINELILEYSNNEFEGCGL